MVLYYDDLFDEDDKYVGLSPMHLRAIEEQESFFKILSHLVIHPEQSFSSAQKVGALLRERDAQNWPAVIDMALYQCRYSEVSLQGILRRHNQDDYWMFFGEAAHAAFRQNTADGFTRLQWELHHAHYPCEGYFAAEALLRLSVWASLRNKGREHKRFMQMSLAADPTWAEPALFVARHLVKSDPKRAARLLRDVLYLDPARKDALLADDTFSTLRPLLIRGL